MPIPTPFQDVPDTVFRQGTMPALALSRGDVLLPLSETSGWVILAGVEGLDDPPRTLIEVEPAMWDGSLLTGARYSTRDIFLPLHFMGDSTEQLRATLRDLAALTNVKRGPDGLLQPVTLHVAHADGAHRSIDGHLSAPFAKDLAEGEGALWRRIGLTLRCPDPLFAGEPQTLTFVMGGLIPDFLSDTFLPVRLADSQVVGQITVTNTGDADAWPVWKLTGPADTATVTLAGTSWSMVRPLDPGQTLVVDARRGAYHPVQLDGLPAWGHLAPGAVLGTLPPGTCPITVDVAGATAATSLAVSWSQRWLTAW